MSTPEEPHAETPRGRAAFLTTHWSIVQAAVGADAPSAREALSTLCESYWYPLYAFARRCGHGAEDARDLTQGFFARLIERRDLAGADPERGRFRSFLLACMKHFLSDQRRREQALKRGGGRSHLSFDFENADTRYRLDPLDGLTPERAFMRSWALSLLERTLERLGDDYAQQGKRALFERLRPTLTGNAEGPSRSELAAELGMAEGALNVAVHRLRRRYGEALRAEIAQTLSDPAEVEEELRELFEALGP